MIPGVFSAAATSVEPPAIWTPEDLSVAPKIWTDWNSAVTDVSGFASNWDNKGSFGGSFTQSASAARPEIVPSALNGKRVLRFNGSTDIMGLPTGRDVFRNTDGGWVFAVSKKRGTDSPGQERFLLRTYTASGGTRMHIMQGAVGSGANRIGMNARRLDADGTGAGVVVPTQTSGQWVMSYVEQRWSTGAGRIVLGGVEAASNPSITSAGSTSNTAGSADPTIGASSVGQLRPADIDVACIVVGDGGVLTLPDRLRMEGWAAWECGLQDDLPVGHPYRGAPPYQTSAHEVALGPGATETTLSVPYVQGVEVASGAAWVTSSGESTVLRKHDTDDWSVLASATFDDLTPGIAATSLGDPTLHDGVLYIPCGVYADGGSAFVIEVDPDTLAYITHHDLSADCGSGVNSIVRHGGRWYVGESASSDPSATPALRVFDDSFAHVGIAWKSYEGARIDFQGATILGGTSVMAVGGHDDWLYLFHLSGATAELVDAVDLRLDDIQGVAYHAGEIYATYRQSGQKVERYALVEAE